jgi:hypothetical protein
MPENADDSNVRQGATDSVTHDTLTKG